MRAIKRLKGIWWMPWWQEAMKDVVRCDKPRGAANKLRSVDFRMGQPILDSQSHKSAQAQVCTGLSFWLSKRISSPE
jgi:hypothetical protein